MKTKVITKIKRMINILYNTYGYYSYYHSKIDLHLVYLVSHSGSDFTGNILRIAQELSTNKYGNYKLVIQAQRKNKLRFKNLLSKYNIHAEIVTKKYRQIYLMEKAGYIFTDSVLRYGYVKKRGQIVINTWHGTPFKHMGKKIEAELHTIGNTQRALFMADYVLFPNKYMQDIFLQDYMLSNLWQGKSLLGGYPRNSVFFDSERRKLVKRELHLENKKVYAYLPTHRGNVYQKKNLEQKKSLLDYFYELDEELSDNQVLLVKLHLYNNQKIDYSLYKHIQAWPSDYETYDVLNIADCLITDYSSVFFDYANTKRKIILFVYDKEEYFTDRGVYFNLDILPFPKVYNVNELINELNTPKQYDDTIFLKTYCSYDNKDASQLLCEQIFLGKKVIKVDASPNNGKSNIIFYIGALTKNGITSAGINILKTIDTSRYNYIILFAKNIVKYADYVKQIPEGFNYYAIDGVIQYTLIEKIVYKIIKKSIKKNTFVNLPMEVHSMFKREYLKYFFNIPISYFIDFCGYDKNISLIFNESLAKKSIFVHNDMKAEAKEKNNTSISYLKYIYNSYDKVVGVSNTCTRIAAEIANNGNYEKKFLTVHNCFDYKNCLKKSKEKIKFDENTICTTDNPLGITGVLSSSGYKFITIGRFSKEKNHKQLIDAFDLFWQLHKDAQLIIIGGHGILYEQTLDYRKRVSCCSNITIIKSISNPIPILSKCHLFVLSSQYEGLPVVFFEANCVGVPILSTDIDGAREFMKNTEGGLLVKNSVEGLYNGMKTFAKGQIKHFPLDMKKYNKKCIDEFSKILER